MVRRRSCPECSPDTIGGLVRSHGKHPDRTVDKAVAAAHEDAPELLHGPPDVSAVIDFATAVTDDALGRVHGGGTVDVLTREVDGEAVAVVTEKLVDWTLTGKHNDQGPWRQLRTPMLPRLPVESIGSLKASRSKQWRTDSDNARASKRFMHNWREVDTGMEYLAETLGVRFGVSPLGVEIVAGKYAAFADDVTNVTFPSHETLAGCVPVQSKRTVRNATVVLEWIGFFANVREHPGKKTIRVVSQSPPKGWPDDWLRL